jgi:hypothetical protein
VGLRSSLSTGRQASSLPTAGLPTGRQAGVFHPKIEEIKVTVVFSDIHNDLRYTLIFATCKK